MNSYKQQTLFRRMLRYPFKYLIKTVWSFIIGCGKLGEKIITTYCYPYTRLDPRLKPAVLHRREDGLWEISVAGSSYLFPDLANNSTSLKHGTAAKILMYGFDADPMVSRYEDRDVMIETDDVVVDVGGYIGMFATYASSSGASRVYSLEPTPASFQCLQHNTASDEVIDPYQLGVWSEPGTMQLDLSADPTDNRLSQDGTVDVDVVTIEEFARSNNIDTIDFLKVDVEGLELSVLEGIGTARVKKIGVDAGEGANSNPEDVSDLLSRCGYDVWRTGHMVYGISRS